MARTTTRNGLAGDEVISALQKSIRRGYERAACEFAYEMYITSPQYEEKLWRRLLAISVEDIGMGNPEAAIMVNNFNQMRKEFQCQLITNIFRASILIQYGLAQCHLYALLVFTSAVIYSPFFKLMEKIV